MGEMSRWLGVGPNDPPDFNPPDTIRQQLAFRDWHESDEARTLKAAMDAAVAAEKVAARAVPRHTSGRDAGYPKRWHQMDSAERVLHEAWYSAWRQKKDAESAYYDRRREVRDSLGLPPHA